MELQLSPSVFLTEASLPSVLATMVYLCLSVALLARLRLPWTPRRIGLWVACIVGAVALVEPQYTPAGFAITAMSANLVGFILILIASVHYLGRSQIPRYRSAKALNLVDFWIVGFLSNLAADVGGALRFSGNDLVGIVGGAGYLDGLVWVPVVSGGVLFCLSGLNAIEDRKTGIRGGNGE